MPYAVTYRIRDTLTGRTRKARILLTSSIVAERIAALMQGWPEFSEIAVVIR